MDEQINQTKPNQRKESTRKTQ